ncbi:MAG TPA: 4'-phosphopantetheinyl transferase superfamily protein [Tepidisphaeraceae bacterium]|nr:4'-phosphopantetheinyl transferase superfamily protein [Tepidisphaeraceae bacterium]
MQDELRSTVAQFLGVDVAAVTPALPLTGRRLQGSLGRAMLDAAIRRRVGVNAPAVHTARTYGELESAVLGTPPPGAASSATDHSAMTPPAASAIAAPVSVAGAPDIQCGVDIEAVANLPQASDPWSDEFYQQHFSPAEIAYCAMQPDPRMHFAGRWCAKEALIKCDPSLAAEPLHTLEVVPSAGGPTLRRLGRDGARELPHALSISHTQDMAIAMVVLHHPHQPPAVASSPPAAAPAQRPSPALAAAVLPMALALAALAVALAALFISWRAR